MESRKDLTKLMSKLDVKVKTRVLKVAEETGLDFEQVVIILANRFNCDAQNALVGKPMELNLLGTFKLKRRYDRTFQEGRGGDSSVIDGSEDIGAV